TALGLLRLLPGPAAAVSPAALHLPGLLPDAAAPAATAALGLLRLLPRAAALPALLPALHLLRLLPVSLAAACDERRRPNVCHVVLVHVGADLRRPEQLRAAVRAPVNDQGRPGADLPGQDAVRLDQAVARPGESHGPRRGRRGPGAVRPPGRP